MSNSIFLTDGRQTWRPSVDPMTSHRVEGWRVELLNLKDTALGPLDGVKGGQFTLNRNATIRGGGSIEYMGPTKDWLRLRVQPWYSFTAGGQTVEWPIGVFIPASPSLQYGAGQQAGSISLYDKTHILDQDRVDNTFVAAEGAVVTELVRSIITDTGETRIAVTDSDATLRKAMAWEAGTSKLRIINDLLESINYFSIWTDGWGTFRADPYTSPGSRLSQYNFIDDDTGIYLPEFTHDEDGFNVPNKVICIAQSNGDEPALVAVATNTDPNNKYSYPYRGRWITRVEEGVEATDQATLDSIAERLLNEGRQVGSTYEIKHAPIQVLPNDAVSFRRDAHGLSFKATVETISYSMSTGALCSTTLREVQE